MAASPTQHSWSPAIVALVALMLSSVLLVLALSSLGWDPTLFVGFGEEAEATRQYGEELLGPVYLRPQQGHDGKFFFVQANDPWLTDPQTNASIMDAPVYRSQRMLYPTLAGGLGLLNPESIVWSLLVVNVLAMAAGTYVTARFAENNGASSWWGLAFVLNIGLMYGLVNDSAGVLAAALSFGAVLAVTSGRNHIAVGLMAAASLSREVMVVVAIGLAVWLWLQNKRRSAFEMVGVSIAVVVAWSAYIRFRLGPDSVDIGAISFPGAGLVASVSGWFEQPVAVLAGFGMVLVIIAYTYRWFQRGTALSWAFIGFVPLALVISEKVWASIFDFTRALAPLLTAAVLLIYVEKPIRPSSSTSLRERLRVGST